MMSFEPKWLEPKWRREQQSTYLLLGIWCHLRGMTLQSKKGDPGLCKNYSPITVVSAGYKLFAMALLTRLQNAGAEERIWPIQFAFRTTRGNADAIFVALRLLDLTLADRNGTLVMLSLDWEKAFDSVSPDGLLYALERFGLPPLFHGLIRAIYSNRTFTVRACGHSSASHTQCFGISQGCPLSPFLFTILMTVLFTDASREFQSVSGLDSPPALVHDLIYADDTRILSLQPRQAESFMYRVLDAGRVYGLSLNWGKTEVLPIGCDADLQGPNGEPIKNKTSLVYLGIVISAYGSFTSEVNRRLGMAKSRFRCIEPRLEACSSGMRKEATNLLGLCGFFLQKRAAVRRRVTKVQPIVMGNARA